MLRRSQPRPLILRFSVAARCRHVKLRQRTGYHARHSRPTGSLESNVADVGGTLRSGTSAIDLGDDEQATRTAAATAAVQIHESLIQQAG